jgi:hypothetical protein
MMRISGIRLVKVLRWTPGDGGEIAFACCALAKRGSTFGGAITSAFPSGRIGVFDLL